MKTTLTHMRILFFMALLLMCHLAKADVDGISESVRSFLLQRFAPIIYPNEIHDVPEQGSGVPVSITWLLRNSQVIAWSGTNYSVLLDKPDVGVANSLVQSHQGGGNMTLGNHYVWGDSPGDTRSWPISIGLGEGVYGRVWKPWPDLYPYVYSVQYFLLLTWNETAYSGGFGNHESDWVCVDYAIDVRSGYENPPIIHAVYHAHGPQNFITPELLKMENGHPVVYLEKGTNEAWPNAGGRGFTGWPNSNGFETDGNWDNTDWWKNLLTGWLTFGTQDINEDKVVREHNGNGNRYATHNIPDIGGYSNGTPVSLCGEEGTFLLTYQGQYGTFAGNPPFVNDITPPNGPPFQSKMWSRSWAPNGPWSPLRDPFSPDTSGFYINTTAGYTFKVPSLRDPTYVDFNVQQEGDGSSGLPYRNPLLGLAMTAPSGTIVIQPGTFSQQFQINQAVTLRAPNGSVTIGH
jgi:hypothetical protein